MKTKLTLSIDEELVRFARQVARRRSTSVSGMFSEYLKNQEGHDKQAAVLRTADVVGVLKAYKIDDSKSAIRAGYAKKYLN